MQTFLPYADFKKTALVLDAKRLNKQRVEAKQLLSGQWPNHPASKMWRGYEAALALYGEIICLEWISRGYKDSLRFWFNTKLWDYRPDCRIPIVMPLWFGNEAFHAAHRSNLLRKNPEWYSQFNWTESNDLPYIWP